MAGETKPGGAKKQEGNKPRSRGRGRSHPRENAKKAASTPTKVEKERSIKEAVATILIGKGFNPNELPHAAEVLTDMRYSRNIAPVPDYLLPYVLGIVVSLPKKIPEEPFYGTTEARTYNQAIDNLDNDLFIHSQRINAIREKQVKKLHDDGTLDKVIANLPDDLRRYITPEEGGGRLIDRKDRSRDEWETMMRRLKEHSYLLGLLVRVHIESEARRSSPRDLPDMPEEKYLEYAKNPKRVSIGILRFAHKLKELHHPPEVARFAEYFGPLIMKYATSEAHGATARNAMIGAYWALVSFGIIQEEYDEETRSFDVSLSVSLMREHVQTFILLEQNRRLPEAKEKLAKNTKLAEDVKQEYLTALDKGMADLQKSPAFALAMARLAPVIEAKEKQKKINENPAGSEERKKAQQELETYRGSDDFVNTARVFTAGGAFIPPAPENDRPKTIIELLYNRLAPIGESQVGLSARNLPIFENEFNELAKKHDTESLPDTLKPEEIEVTGIKDERLKQLWNYTIEQQGQIAEVLAPVAAIENILGSDGEGMHKITMQTDDLALLIRCLRSLEDVRYSMRKTIATTTTWRENAFLNEVRERLDATLQNVALNQRAADNVQSRIVTLIEEYLLSDSVAHTTDAPVTPGKDPEILWWSDRLIQAFEVEGKVNVFKTLSCFNEVVNDTITPQMLAAQLAEIVLDQKDLQERIDFVVVSTAKAYDIDIPELADDKLSVATHREIIANFLERHSSTGELQWNGKLVLKLQLTSENFASFTRMFEKTYKVVIERTNAPGDERKKIFNTIHTALQSRFADMKNTSDMSTIREKAPQAKRMADELDALLSNDAPNPQKLQKPIGPSEKEKQLAKDLALLAKRNNELVEELKKTRGATSAQHEGNVATVAVLETQINTLRDELKEARKAPEPGNDSTKINELNARIAELKEQLEAAGSTAAPVSSLESAELAQLRTQQEAQAAKIRELNKLIEERDQQLEKALTPKALEEVKRTFADAIYNTFKEVDNKNPGFLSSVLSNPKISRERKEWIIEAFRANGEEIVLDL